MPLPTTQPPAEQALPALCLRHLAGLRLSPHCFIPGQMPWDRRISLQPSEETRDVKGLGEFQDGSSSTLDHSPLGPPTLGTVTGVLFKALSATRARLLLRMILSGSQTSPPGPAAFLSHR